MSVTSAEKGLDVPTKPIVPSKFNMKNHILQSNMIEGFGDDPEMLQQSLHAWDWLILIPYEEIGHATIRRLQKMITLPQTDLQPNERGYYRGEAGNTVQVTVGGRLGAAPAMVKHYMENWLLVRPFTHPRQAHVQFEKIHPFVDGNGRTGRMLMWYEELVRYAQKPTLIKYNERYKYYAWFNN